MASRERKLTIAFLGDARSLSQAAGAGSSSLDKFKVAIDDSESAGKQLARAMEQAAVEIEADLKQAQSAAEKLGQALGPEISAKLAQGGGGVDGMVAKLRAAGLTYDDIEADVDEVAAAIKRLDQTGAQLDGVSKAATTVEGDFKRVAGEADNTRSVVANFAGNAVQELPGIGSAMGPLNMAIGQFGEYATEGNIKLKNFIMAGAGLAVVSVALSAIGDHFKKIAAEKAFKKSEVDAYADAIRETGSAVGALKRVLSDAGKIEVWNPNTMSTWDVTAAFAAAGLTIDNMTKLLQGGKPAIDEWEASMRAAGVPALAVDGVVFTLNEKLKVMEGGARAAAASAAFFGDATEDAGKQVDTTRREVADLVSGIEILKGALSIHDAKDEFVKAQDEMTWASVAAWQAAEDQTLSEEEKAEALLASEEATRHAIDATIDYIDQLGDIPKEKATAIQALIDEGSFAQAQQRLEIFARNLAASIVIEANAGPGYGPIKGPRAAGGEAFARSVHPVNERGIELLTVAGSDFLLMGDQGGQITPNHQLGGMGGTTVVNNIDVHVGGSVVAERDLVRAVHVGILDGLRRGELIDAP